MTCFSCCAPERRLPDSDRGRYTSISRKVFLVRLNFCLLTLAALPVFAASPKPAVVNAVSDRYRPLAFDQQKLAGVLAERIRASREGYLEHVNDTVLLASLHTRNAEADQGQYEREQVGRFLDAAANAFDYSRDPNLKAVMDRVAGELLAAGSGNGGALQAASSYDLLGLLAYYRVTGDEDAIAASTRIGDGLMAQWKKETHVEGTRRAGVLEPFVYLFRYTRDMRYLDFAESLATSWNEAKPSEIDSTYATLSDLVGLAELYRVTGDESYFRDVVAAWKSILANNLTITGAPIATDSAASAAHLASSQKHDPRSDICSTAAWVQLTLELLRLTGDPVYADQLELTIYNQLFAGQDNRTGNVFSDAPLDGRKQMAPGNDHCNAAEAEGISLIPAAAWGRYGKGIAVSLYTGGRATFRLRRRGTVQLYSEAMFPETGALLLHVEPAHNLQFPLRLRVPDWTSSFVAEIGGSRLVGRPGEFLTINREWKRGDTVKIEIDMTVHAIDARERSDRFALQRGPQILALGKAVNPEITDLTAAVPMSSDTSQLKTPPGESRFPASWAGNQAYTFPGEYEGQPRQLVLVPFADAVNYQVWLRKPAAASAATY